jgi:hypothetical protein
LIIAALAVHLILNIVFCIIYCTKVRLDVGFTHWRSDHRFSSTFVPTLASIANFHFIRIIYSGFCNLKGCKATFTDITVLLKPLVRLTYISIFCTHLPLIASQVLTLVHFTYSDYIWFAALDSLFVTVLVTILMCIDLRMSEKQLILAEKGLVQVAEMANFSALDKSLNEQSFNGNSTLPLLRRSRRKHQIRKGISKSLDRFPFDDYDSVLDSARAARKLQERRHSFPSSEVAEFLPAAPAKRLVNTPRGVKRIVEPLPLVSQFDEPQGEEIIFNSKAPKSKEELFDELVTLPPEEEGLKGELEVIKVEKKQRNVRLRQQMFVAFSTNSNEQQSGFIDMATERGMVEEVQLPEQQVVSSKQESEVEEPLQAPQEAEVSIEPREEQPEPIQQVNLGPREVQPEEPREVQPAPKPQPLQQVNPELREVQLAPKPELVAKPVPAPVVPAKAVSPVEHKPEPIAEKKPEVIQEPVKLPQVVSPPVVLASPPQEEAKAARLSPPVTYTPAPQEEVKVAQLAVPVAFVPPPKEEEYEMGESTERAVTAELMREEPFVPIPAAPQTKNDSMDRMPKDPYNYQDEGSILEAEEPVPKAKIKENYLGTIEEETEFDFERAIMDGQDPEVVTVPNLESGERFRLKKDFKGSRIVDLENKVVETIPPIESSRYVMPMTIVDEADVHFATLTSQSGESVRVKRSFKGARIIDLEQKVSHPQAYLIGQSVQREEDFQFHNAVPDPNDPEVVIVMHNETGADVKVRKNFHGARMVDQQGNVLVEKPPINRNDYDISASEVEPEDVHLATLKHKVTSQRVRVRRDFRGAKIIDLEKKSTGVAIRSLYQDKSEPESPEFSQISLTPEERWRVPSKVKKPPRPVRPIDISDMFANEDPDRRHLDELEHIISELAQKEVEPPGLNETDSFSGVEDEDSLPFNRKIYRRPIYRNMDLDKVYGANAARSSSQMDSNASLTGAGKKKKRRTLLPEDPTKVSNINKIYLQRLGIRPGSTKARDMDTQDLFADLADEFGADSSFNRDRDSSLHFAGNEIVSGRRERRFSRPQ